MVVIKSGLNQVVMNFTQGVFKIQKSNDEWTDEDDYENIVSSKSFISPFFTRKVSTVKFSEGGYTLSRSQNDKTSNIW